MTAKIIVVDDDTNLLRVVEYALKMAGFGVITAENGEDALAAVRAEQPDLMILDVMLPGMSGVQICQQLRDDPATHGLPVIMLSARAQVTDMVTGLESGADEYVTKPVDMQEIVARVTALLKRTDRLQQVKPVVQGKVIGFIGAKGGVGTTTVALSVSAVLSNNRRTAVAAELGPYFGTFSSYLNQRPPENLRGLLDLDPQQIDERVLDAHLYETPYGMKILFGPQAVDDLGDIEADQVVAVITGLAGMAEYTVVDFPCDASDGIRAVMGLCSAVVLVTEPDPGCVAAGKTVLGLLAQWGVGRSMIGVVVVNRTSIPITPTLAEIKAELDCEILGSVPLAPAACVKAQEVGVPIAVYQPESTVASALGDIARRLAE